MRASVALATVLLLALSCAPGPLRAAPPPASADASERSARPSKRAKGELAAGGVLLGLGFAAELAGAVISARCTTGNRCAVGIALAFGVPDGPNRYAFVSTGPSGPYIAGRLVAAPLLIGGFTATMIGLASLGEPTSSWSHAKRRRLAWSLFGAGLGVLVGSRILRMAFLDNGICQTPMCVHGLDQSSLWIGRGLTFAGTGMLVRGAARPTELELGGGPSSSFGLSLSGRF